MSNKDNFCFQKNLFDLKPTQHQPSGCANINRMWRGLGTVQDKDGNVICQFECNDIRHALDAFDYSNFFKEFGVDDYSDD